MTVEVQVWNAANDTMLAVLSRRWGVQWQDEFNGAGVGNVTVHKSDPAATESNLAYFNVIRFVYEGATRFAFRIEQRRRTVVGQGGETAQAWKLSGRGLLAMLSDAVLYPEYGLERLSGSQRYFNWASVEGDWYISADWHTPLGVRQDAVDESDPRFGFPLGWTDPAAQWIWSSDPEVTIAGNLVNWFRAEFTLAAETTIRVYTSADNWYKAFLDGEIIQDQMNKFPGWDRYQTYEATLAAGTHLLAAQVQNAPPWFGSYNPAAFIAIVVDLEATGYPGNVLLRTNTTAWKVNNNDVSDPPGWRPHHILAQLVDEAQARNAFGPDAITKGWTASVDSDGVTWTLARTERSFRVGEDNLSVVSALVEDSGMDVWLDPATMTLEAFEGRGTDLSTGSAPVVLRPAESLTDFTVEGQRLTATRLLVETEDGWAEVADSAQETAVGRIEGLVSLGGVYTNAQAEASGQNILGVLAQQGVDAVARHTVLKGPKPYVDYDNGDTILAPEGWTPGAFAAYRVLAITVTEGDDGTVTVADELEAV